MARYALVIGIAQYRSPLSNLEKTTSDAEAVAQILEKCGDFDKVIRLPARLNPDKNVYEMVARGVTGAELGQTLKTFFLERADKSEALIYFTGHGITVSDHLGQQKGYLATSDCVIETQDKDIIEQQHGIALDSLNDLIRTSNLSSLVLLLDCCHGGYFLERNLVEQTLTAFSSQKDYYLITACRGFEQAWAIKTEQHDVFTGALLKGLAPENAGRDGRISGDRLFDYINAELQGARQEPIRMGWGRSITLVTHTSQQSTAVSTQFRQENPYQGLQAFESEQEAYFCGREQAIWALLGRLTTNRFVAVIGPSGCGKSSLVKAGLLPQIGRDRLPGSSHWGTEIFTPGKHPLEKLMEILNRRHQQNQPFVLFIDQFEELFTLCEDNAERWNFIRLMAEEATGSERMTRVIVAIRTAFLEQCAPYPEAADLINQARPTTYIVPPLTFPELEAAIEQPASLHGVTFERGLVSQIANDVVERPGALPLLQYALTELWRVCIQEPPSPQPFLTWQGYQAIGGVKGALEQRANLLYQSFSPKDQALIRCLFLELVQLNEGGEVSRRRATWSDLEALADSPEQLDRVTRLLSGQQQRLIITSDKTVEVAHEALFSEWKLLHDWIEENRDDIQINRRLEAACREWQDTYQQSDDALLTGAPLAAIEAWAKKSQPKLPPQEAEFLQKSVEKRDRQLQSQLEQERRLREEAEARAKSEAARAKSEAQKTRTAVAAGVLATLTLGLGLLTTHLIAQRTKVQAVMTGALISNAQQLYEKHNQLEALIASIHALKELKKISIEDNDVLAQLQSIVYGIQEANRLQNHQAETVGIDFSPDGTTLISAGADRKINFWNTDGRLLKTLSEHTDVIWSVQFSSDNKMAASASWDGTVKLWSREGKFLRTLQDDLSDDYYDVSFSPDNKIVAASTLKGTIKLWDTTNGQLIKTLTDRNTATQKEPLIFSIDFHPTDRTIIVGSSYFDDSVKLWNLKTGRNDIPSVVGRHSDVVTSVRFNSTGSILASASQDGTIKFWNTKENRLIGNIRAHKRRIYGLGFSRNNKFIASASEDETIKIWSVEKALRLNSKKSVLETPVTIFQGHSASVNQVAFNPSDEKLIASTSDDYTVRIWKVDLNEDKLRESDPPQPITLLKYSCDLLKNYLLSNKEITPETRQVCDNVTSSF